MSHKDRLKNKICNKIDSEYEKDEFYHWKRRDLHVEEWQMIVEKLGIVSNAEDMFMTQCKEALREFDTSLWHDDTYDRAARSRELSDINRMLSRVDRADANEVAKREFPGVEHKKVKFGRGDTFTANGEEYTIVSGRICDCTDEDSDWDYASIAFLDEEHNGQNLRLTMLLGMDKMQKSNINLEKRTDKKPYQKWYRESYVTDIEFHGREMIRVFDEVDEGDKVRWDGRREWAEVSRTVIIGSRKYVYCTGSRGGEYKLTLFFESAVFRVERTSGQGLSHKYGKCEELIIQ